MRSANVLQQSSIPVLLNRRTILLLSTLLHDTALVVALVALSS